MKKDPKNIMANSRGKQMGRLKTYEERQRKIMKRKEEKKKLHKLAVAARQAKPKVEEKDEKPT